MIVSSGYPLYRQSPRIEESLRISAEMLDAARDPAQQVLQMVELLESHVNIEVGRAAELMHPEGKGFLELTWIQPMRDGV